MMANFNPGGFIVIGETCYVAQEDQNSVLLICLKRHFWRFPLKVSVGVPVQVSDQQIMLMYCALPQECRNSTEDAQIQGQ